MARMIVRYCVWTILFFSQLTLFRANAAETNRRNLHFDAGALLDIAKFEMSIHGRHRLDSMGQTECDLFSRLRSRGRSAEQPKHLAKPLLSRLTESDLPPRPRVGVAGSSVAPNVISTCPVEASDSADCRPLVVQNHVKTSQRFGQSWILTCEFFASQLDYLRKSMRSVKPNFGAMGERVRDSAESARNLVTSKVFPTGNRSMAKTAPIIRVSRVKAVPKDPVPDSILTNEIEATTGDESLIETIQIEDSTDSYWQYYEDCDRWGVNFAILLIQTNAINSYCDASIPATQPRELETENLAVCQPCSVVGILAMQGPITCLCAAPKIAKKATRTMRNWFDVCEFHAAESESVDLDSFELGRLHPSWSFLALELQHRTQFVRWGLTETTSMRLARQYFKCLVELGDECKNRVSHVFALVLRKLDCDPAASFKKLRHQVAKQIKRASVRWNDVVDSDGWLSSGFKASNTSISTGAKN